MADNLAKRKMKVDFQKITELYHHANALQFELNQMRSQHNRNSKNLIADKQLKASITEKTGILNELNMTLSAQAKLLPNEIHISVPATEQLVFQSNETPVYDFIPKTHLDLATHHNMLDIARAGKVSGSGFYYLKGPGALLEMALTRYAMDICIKHGFEPIITPDIIRTSILDGCGFSPRSNDPHTYFLKSADPSCLAATAEFPLAGMYSNEVLGAKTLPKKMVGVGHAFRAEGVAGGANRGLYRVHQFTKVEMFALDTAEKAMDTFYSFINIQKEILSGLELVYRVINMPAHELGAPAHIKYDMEAWMPGRQSWGEVSSTSNCTDYQSTRLNIRTLVKGSYQYVSTINGTAAAIPRLIIAILETHQQNDASIYIPERLRKYLYGQNISFINSP